MPEHWKRVWIGESFAEVKLKKKYHLVMAISEYLKDDNLALGLREIHRNLYLSYIQLKLKDRTWIQVLQSKNLFPAVKDEEISGKCSPFQGRNLSFICEVCYSPFSVMCGCHSLFLRQQLNTLRLPYPQFPYNDWLKYLDFNLIMNHLM